MPKSDHELSYFKQLAYNDTLLMENGIDFWKYPSESINDSPIDVMFSPKAKQQFLPQLLSMNLQSKVMIENVQQ